MNLANPFQNKNFAKFQLQAGKATKIHTLKNRQGKKFVVYQLPLFKNYTILYTYDYSPALKKIAKKNRSIYTLIEPHQKIKIPKSQKTVRSIKNVIPRHTNLINLDQSEEEIFNKMHPKGRYNIRLATKKNLTIKTSDNIDEFFALLQTTADRDNFHVNNSNFYKLMLDILGKTKNAKLFMAYHDNQPIAGILTVYFKKTAIYYYGASANTHRNLMAPYLLQWHAIKDAKLNGFQYYDFLGVADPTNPKDKLKGVTYFKQKFGGDYTKLPDSLTIVHNAPLFYLLKFRTFCKKLLNPVT